MTKDEIQKVRDAISAALDASIHQPTRWRLIDAIETIDAALARDEKPVGMVKRSPSGQVYIAWEGDQAVAMLNLIDKPLYTHPPEDAKDAARWTSVKDAMPQSGVKVLACYRNSHGNLRRIRAEWTAAKTVESNLDFDFGEYDEATDCYYAPEGWYECIDNWVEYSSVMVSEGEVTHWMPLPLAPEDAAAMQEVKI